jgi:MFS family permease
VWFVNGVLAAPLTTQLPVYVESLHWPPIFTAGLQSALMGVGAIASILGGVLADTIGIKRALLIGLAGSIAASLLFFSAVPALMLVLAVLGGAAIGCQNVASQAYLLAAVRNARLGIGTAAFFLGNTFGSSLGNLVTGKALDRVGFPPVMGAITVCSCLLVLGAALFLPAVPMTVRAEPVRRVLARYGKLLQRRDVALLCGVRYLTTCFWGAVTLLLPLLLYRLTGSKGAAGTYAAASLAFAACCSVGVGRLSDRLGRRRPALALTMLIVVDAFLLARFSASYTGLFAAGVLGSGAAWSLSTLMPGLIDEVSGAGEKGRAVGLLQGVWSSAMLSGSLLAGALVPIAAMIPFLVVGLANVGAVMLMVALLRAPRTAPST